jgi:hypothetical protein
MNFDDYYRNCLYFFEDNEIICPYCNSKLSRSLCENCDSEHFFHYNIEGGFSLKVGDLLIGRNPRGHYVRFINSPESDTIYIPLFHYSQSKEIINRYLKIKAFS